MVREAEANAEADKKRRELVEARNSAEAMVHQVEKTLKEDGDKVPARQDRGGGRDRRGPDGAGGRGRGGAQVGQRAADPGRR